MNSRLFAILFSLFTLSFFEASASHIVGGEFTYQFLGDSIGGGGVVFHRYLVTLAIYQDCQNGQPEAIAQDNPAILAAFVNGIRTPYDVDSGVYFDPVKSIPVPANFSNSCVTNIPPVCLLKKVFIKRYAFRTNPQGYTVAYQRCCRNNAIVNIINPGDNGSTYFCTIPGTSATNNSAVFNNYPPQIICLNNPLFYDHSATDPDGDSLTYEFCTALEGANGTNIKPQPSPPPYTNTSYVNPPYSFDHPMTGFPPITIDPHTGMITGTPNRIGRYLVTVCCNEWRNGVIINTIKREFQFVVTDCSKVVVADIPQFSEEVNTYIVNCKDYTVHFVNTSSGGFDWHWDFGVENSGSDVSSEFEPTYTFPDTGIYSVKLVVNPGTTCPDSITRLVKIYPQFVAGIADSGRQCPGAPINFLDKTFATMKPVNYWEWYFGNGDSSFDQNPVYTYSRGGTYNVILISRSIKGCIDTALKRIVIQDFSPFAGNDTVIVKGEHILFNASGGTSYAWTPSSNLSDTGIYNPVGYYPDTGTFEYNVHVKSDYGCEGDDSIRVQVVNQAAFFVPSAFTPNGDGLNDIFRPVAIGYRGLQYFRVYNRFGEMVYDGKTLETGWDGTYSHHRQCDIGVYFWQIKFTDRFGNDGFLKGDVTLLR